MKCPAEGGFELCSSLMSQYMSSPNVQPNTEAPTLLDREADGPHQADQKYSGEIARVFSCHIKVLH